MTIRWFYIGTARGPQRTYKPAEAVEYRVADYPVSDAGGVWLKK